MTYRPALYVASPLGFSEGGLHFLSELVILKLETTGYRIFNPWAYLRTEPGLKSGATTKNLSLSRLRAISRKNADLIRRSSLMFAILDGSDVDSGVAAEVGLAYALGKQIVGYRGDFRPSGDTPDSLVNAQVEFFIHDSGGAIYRHLPEAIGAIKRTRRRST